MQQVKSYSQLVQSCLIASDHYIVCGNRKWFILSVKIVLLRKEEWGQTCAYLQDFKIYQAPRPKLYSTSKVSKSLEFPYQLSLTLTMSWRPEQLLGEPLPAPGVCESSHFSC